MCIRDRYYAVYAATDLIYAAENYWGMQPDFTSLLLRDLRGLKIPGTVKVQELQKRYDKLWVTWELSLIHIFHRSNYIEYFSILNLNYGFFPVKETRYE